ncbi:FAD-dependent oxidoreductase [Curtobacterium sp. SL109]|uniref:FAD-dependent oxidoreductase n=1 Tax=Curtobacterium sp. SL109 TaxID=2994662 RepID=UPI002DD423F2|nr:FAD-dependent monooxygenase [Curtobacterium sp. SL109]
MALAPGKGIHAHREAGHILHGYVQLTKSAEWFFSIDFGDRAAAAARVAAEFTGWAPALLDLITESDTTLVARPIYTLPTPYQWDHFRGVTLIGDAAHLMAPAGEGANLAMLDGAELGLALAQRDAVGFEEAVAGWESVMFPRSEDAALRSVFVNDLTLGDGAPHAAADFFTRVSGNSVEASPAV